MSCNVCVEPFNKSYRLEVTCNYCDFCVCRECCKAYILQSTQHAHCMNCKREWTREVLVEKFTRKFVDVDYKKQKEKLLLEQERALLPATQSVVEDLNKKEAIKQEICQVKDQIKALQGRLYDLEMDVREVGSSKPVRTFVRKCPYGDCRGFLSTQWKCGLCEMWACPDCHEIKGETRDVAHECKDENLKTARLLEKDTKACPKCATPIFKIDGCDQMWCTQCQTAFSWKTGRIETTVHNPHYFEYMRRAGLQERNPADVQCGREIDNTFVRELNNIQVRNGKMVSDVCRDVIHMRLVNLPRFMGNGVQHNQDLRVQYLRGKINEDKFKQMIQKRDKSTSKKHEISNVLGMFVASATDILYRYKDDARRSPSDVNVFTKYKSELVMLRVYANECLEKIGKVYNSKVYVVTDKMDVI